MVSKKKDILYTEQAKLKEDRLINHVTEIRWIISYFNFGDKRYSLLGKD
jgi:hypothetical protein